MGMEEDDITESKKTEEKPIKWSDDYAIGIERIDREHKMLFRIVGDFRVALSEGGGEQTYDVLLQALEAFCHGHFGFEERCMEEYHCPMAQKNKSEHVKLQELLFEFQQLYSTNGYDQREAFKLIGILEQWLTDHICRIDVHLKNCVKE